MSFTGAIFLEEFSSRQSKSAYQRNLVNLFASIFQKTLK